VDVEKRGGRERKRGEVVGRKGGRQWIMQKKEEMERRGKVVKHHSKYTGRKRKVQF